MTDKRRILVQLDSDPHASVFDAVVAADAGVDVLLRHAPVEPGQVRDLVHGAMFTRGPADLKHTAIFVGGSNVAAGETLLRQAVKCFFGPIRVSVMLDSNGANTTAAAAVLAAARHVPLPGARAAVLGASGPVGQRIARLLVRQGADVVLGSRSLARAEETAAALREALPEAGLTPVSTGTPEETRSAIEGCSIVIAAGAAGVELVSYELRQTWKGVRMAADLNAAPPAGINGIDLLDKGVSRDGVICYGAIGVGNAKMKIHKAAIRRLFESNDVVLDAEEIFALGKSLPADSF